MEPSFHLLFGFNQVIALHVKEAIRCFIEGGRSAENVHFFLFFALIAGQTLPEWPRLSSITRSSKVVCALTDPMLLNKLRITEIFYSLQGESRTSGRPTVFVRLTGCPLRCSWCDTEYAFQGGVQMSLEDILTEVAKYSAAYVCVTGGEPLAQPHCQDLLKNLCDDGYEVSLETSGAMALSGVDQRVVKVMDLKPPASGECHRNLYDNIQYLDQKDQVKFVIADRMDYEWSVSKLMEYRLADKVSDVLFSPVHDLLPAAELAGWILGDRLQVRFQVQLHRVIWGDRPGV